MSPTATTTSAPDTRDLAIAVLQAEIARMLPKIGITGIGRTLRRLSEQGAIPHETPGRAGDIDYEIFHAIKAGTLKVEVSIADTAD